MFSLIVTKQELEHSDNAVRYRLDNTIPANLQENAERLSLFLEALELKLVAKYGAAGVIIVSSGYRSPKVNALAGSDGTSFHLQALAADIRCRALTPYQLAQFIKSEMTDWDKVILEFQSWVHVQLPQKGVAPRRTIWTAISVAILGTTKFKTEYVSGFQGA